MNQIGKLILAGIVLFLAALLLLPAQPSKLAKRPLYEQSDIVIAGTVIINNNHISTSCSLYGIATISIDRDYKGNYDYISYRKPDKYLKLVDIIYCSDALELILNKQYIFYADHSMLSYLKVVSGDGYTSAIIEYNDDNERNIRKIM